MMKSLIAVCLASMVLGCVGDPPATQFTVEVMNISPAPVSVGLVKTREPKEEGWTTPADVAIHSPEYSDRHWGELIRPGETKVLGPREGHFQPGSVAVLRVYGGNPTIDELMAVGLRDPDRVDVLLPAGQSSYVITIRGGRLTAVRAAEYRSTANKPEGNGTEQR
ncbi:MAG: hypothetical protein ABSH20_21050 [Tepidisphaeraceae bacterium]|jgi:hypothetical protein